MAEKVEIIIEAQDDASKAIEGVSDSLSGLTSAAQMEALGDLKAAGVDALKALAGVAGEYVDIAAEGEVVQARLEAQIKALGNQSDISASQVNDLATELMKVSGFDDEALVSAETALLRFGNLSEEQFARAARAATDLAALTGQDLTTAFQQVGVALDTGNWGRLTRQIGDLSLAQRQALEAAQDAGDEYAAQQIILDALEQKTQGAAAAIGDTWTGKLAKARQEVDNLKQSIGDGLLGVLNSLPQPMITAGTALGDVGAQVAQVAGPVADMAIAWAALKGTLLGGAGAAAGGGALAGILASIKAALAGVGAVLAGISAPIWLLIAAIGVLIATIVTMGPEAMHTLDMLGQIIGALAKRGLEWGRNMVEGIKNGMAQAWQSLKTWVGDSIASLIAYIKSKLGIASPSKVFAEAIGKPMAQGIGQGFRNALSGIDGVQVGMAGALQPQALRPAFAGGGAGVTVVYSPAISTGTREELINNLVPLVTDAQRRIR